MNRTSKKTEIRIGFFSMLLLCVMGTGSAAESGLSDKISASIEAGIEFLHEFQLDTGGFENETTNDPHKTGWIRERTNTVPAYVLLSLRNLQSEKALSIKNRAADFLLKNKEPPGIWRYWEPGDRRYRLRSPDSDDTSIAWIGLQFRGYTIPDKAVSYIKKFSGPDGRIWTWIDSSIFRFDKAAQWYLNSVIVSLIHNHAANKDEVDQLPWDDRIPRAGDVDAVVNANVLLMFALTGKTDRNIIAFLIGFLESGDYLKGTLFYASPRAFMQALMRTCKMGNITELNATIPLIRSYLLKPETNGFTDDPPLEIALSVSALLFSGYGGDAVKKGVEQILKLQKTDGSWESSVCWRGDYEHQHCLFRSKAYTTALCVEVLDMYLNQRLEN